MRISIIGVGDVEYHFQRLLGMSKEEFMRHIDGIGEVLAQSGIDIVITPDMGSPSKLQRSSGQKSRVAEYTGWFLNRIWTLAWSTY